MKKISLLLPCFAAFTGCLPTFFSSTLEAQTPGWTWAKSAGGNKDENASSICSDAAGNIYAAGSFWSNLFTIGTTTLVNSNPTPTPITEDTYIIKYSGSGNPLWAKSFGSSSGNESSPVMTCDPSGNAVIAGFFNNSTLTIGTYTLTNNSLYGATDAYLAKYDSNGNVLWARSFGGSNAEGVFAITSDASGNIFVGGNYGDCTFTIGTNTITPAGSGNDILLVKYDSGGNPVWVRTAGGPDSEYPTALTIDASGNLLVTGVFQSTSFALGTYTVSGGGAGANAQELFVAKYDNSGNALWAKSAGGADYETTYAITADASGNSIVCGSFQSDTVFAGPDTLINEAASFNDPFVIKFDVNGNVLWARSGKGQGGLTDEAYGVSVDQAGNILLGGFFTGPAITFGSNKLKNISNGNSWDLFLVKYAANGNVLWSKSEGGFASESITAIATDISGDLIVTGNFSSDTVILRNDTLVNLYSYNDLFVAKIPNSCTIATPTVTVSSNMLTSSSAPSYQWLLDGNVLTGETSQSIALTENGSYQVLVTNTSGCSVSSAPVSITNKSGWNWIRSNVVGTDAIFSGVTSDKAGNAIAAGAFFGPSVSFGSSTTLTNSNPGPGDVCVVKYDISGNVLWARSAGGSRNDMARIVTADPSGYIYVSGNFSSPSIVFGSIPLTNNSPQDTTDMFLVKYDSNGNVLWAKSAGGYDDDKVLAMASDKAGNIIIGGTFRSPTITFGANVLTNTNASGYPADAFLVKYNSSGGVMWAKSFGDSGSEDKVTSVATDGSGNILITKNPITAVSFSKYDPNGNFLFTDTVNIIINGSIPQIDFVQADKWDNIFFAGTMESDTLMFDSLVTLVNTGGAGNTFVMKCDATGKAIWGRAASVTPRDNAPTSCTVDSVGNVILSGYFNSDKLSFGSKTIYNPTGYPPGGFSGYTDLFVVKYDSSGNVLMARSVNGDVDEYEASTAVDPAGNIFLAGDYYSSSLSFGTKSLVNSGGTDVFIARYGGCTPVTKNISVSICQGDSILIAGSYQKIAGTYTDTLLAGNGCDSILATTLSINPLPAVSAGATVPAGCNFSTGSISLNVSGGTSPYSYAWLPGGGSSSAATGLATGNYSVTVTDSKTCKAKLTTVLGDSCDYVWPGDANDDGTADNLDILAIGMGYGATGPLRSGASLNWIGQPCSNWTVTLTGNVNYKHIDCSGDGAINSADTVAVVQNYGLIHNNKIINPITNSNTDIFTKITSDSIGSGGALVTVQVGLGTVGNPATNVYGVAYSIGFNDPSLVNAASVSFKGQSSWLGTLGTDLIALGFPNALDASVTRINQQNASGNGFIHQFQFKTSNSLNGTGNSAPLVISINNVTVISANGTVIPVTPLADSLLVLDSALVTSSVNEAHSLQVIVYPNPTNGEFTVYNLPASSELMITNLLGEIIFQKYINSKQEKINIKNAANGIYFLQIRSANRISTGKIIKE